jgi:hypothetical protein
VSESEHDPIAHVRACCPTLIGTLVAMARASKDGRDVDDVPAATTSQGPTGRPADVAP